MRIAILGGMSCFALSLVRVAVKLGHELIGIGRSPSKPVHFALEFAHPRRDYRYYQAHVVDEHERAMQFLDLFKPEVIVNFAAQGEGAVSHKPEHWPWFYRTNSFGLTRLIACLTKRDYLRRFVQIGSSEVYGSVDYAVAEDAPLNPSSIYAHSKGTFDQTLQLAHRIAGFPMNIIRPSNCYVKGQQLHRIIPRAMLCAVTGRKLQLHGGGVAQKSYLHADDLSAAILRVAETAPLGEIYNCGPDNPTSIAEVVDRCAHFTGKPTASFVEQAPERMGQDARYWIDSSKLKALGWRQEIDWDRGLSDTAAWISAYKDTLGALDPEFHLRP